MPKKKETKQTSVSKTLGGVSYQTQMSSSYSTQMSVQRAETKTFFTSSSISLPTTSSTRISIFENKGPNGNTLSSFLSSRRPRSIFDSDTIPLSPSTSSSQSSSLQSRYSPVYQSLRSNKPPPLEFAVCSKNAPSTDAKPFSPVSQPSGNQSISRIPNLTTSTSLTNRNTNEFTQNRDPNVPTYVTNGRKRGKALIVNNVKFMKEKDERKGAEVDERRISDLFRNFGFQIKVYRNLKKSEMNDKINKFKSDRSLEKVDISVMIMMSHGHNSQNGKIVQGGYTQIVGIDGESLPIDEVLCRFDSTNCPALKGKPKLFFFQCCRGEQQEEIHVDAAPIRKVIKQHADMLIAFSTLPGFFSLRDPVRGSWYIQSVCDVFERHAKEYDVETLLKIVDEQLSKKHPQYQQTSSYESRGFKRCFLNPPS